MKILRDKVTFISDFVLQKASSVCLSSSLFQKSNKTNSPVLQILLLLSVNPSAGSKPSIPPTHVMNDPLYLLNERSDLNYPGTPQASLSVRSEEHTSELQSRGHLVCRLLHENKKNNTTLKVTRT